MNRYLIKKYAEYKYRQFEFNAENSIQAYRNLWERTYSLLERSTFWQGRLKRELENNDLTDYNTYKKTIENSFTSHSISLFNNEKILQWALSSGSSGKPKMFPITKSYHQVMKDIHLQASARFFRKYDKYFLKNPIIYIATYGPLETSPLGIDVNYISNFNYCYLPSFIRLKYAIPLQVFSDRETLMNWMPVYAVASDCSAIVAVTPSSIISLLKRISINKQEIFRLISGRDKIRSDLPPLRLSHKRISQIENALFSENEVNYLSIWPSLKMVSTWTGSVCQYQARVLSSLLKDRVGIHESPFSATEAWISIPQNYDKPGGAINPGAINVEFLPIGETDKKYLKKPWELDTGQKYELYITNLMGLVRYRIYDIIECCGQYKNVAEIVFVQKSSRELSLGLFCLSENELMKAITYDESLLKNTNHFFTPSHDGLGLNLYVSNIEEKNIGTIQFNVERGLFQVNDLYAEKVKQKAISPLKVFSLHENHECWNLPHSQAKPYILRNEFILP